MNDRFNGLWLVALIAVAEVFHFSPEPASSAPPARQAQVTDKKAPPASDPSMALTGVQLLQDYYGSKPGTDHVNHLRILFASLPDPVDARAAYKFDEILEALQAGAQDSGFVLDRFSVVWPRKSDPQAVKDLHIDREKPGVLLFRGKDKSDETALVFLVSETPTLGIHKNALTNALTQAANLLKPLNRPFNEVRFVGPNFSGSAKSLQLALTDWFKQEQNRPAVTVHFISGNATGSGARELLDSGADKWAPGLSARFHGLVWSDAVVQKAVDDYLHNHLGVDEKEIAILVESESAYGQGLLHDPVRAGSYRFAFPLHISQLRTSYGDDSKLRMNPVSIADDPMRAALDLSFDEAADPIDIPLPYSPGPTANLAELSLDNIISGLNREHVRYVGLYATDSRDKLFLARLIRSRFPTMQFFTNDSDLLYTHAHYAPEMAGMLVGSTYPLVNQTQTWNRTDDTVRQFSSQGAEGTYNATRAAFTFKELLSSNDDRLLEDPAKELKDYKDPFNAGSTSNRPLVWISAVGNERLWPINVYVPAGKAAVAPGVVANTQRSRTFLALFGGLAAFCLLVSALVLSPAAGKVSRMERAHRFFLCANLLVLFTILTAQAFFVLPASTVLRQIAVFADVMIVFLLGQAAMESAVKGVWRTARSNLVRLLCLPISALILWAVLASPLGIHESATPYEILLAERATRLGSGISPFVPLIFLIAGVCVWIYCDLKRVEWLHHLKGINPLGPPVGATAGFAHLWTRINRTLACWHIGLGRRFGAGVMALVASIIVASVVLGFFTTFEGWKYDWMLRIVFAMLLAALIVSATRFFLIWYQFGRLLRRLSFHPLAEAFKRLDPKFSRGLGTHFSAAPPTLMELEEPVNMLARLKSNLDQAGLRLLAHPHLDAIRSHLNRNYPNVERTYRHEVDSSSRNTLRTWSFKSLTQILLCKEAAFMFSRLEPEWKSPAADPATLHLCEDFIAVEIVAFLDYVFLHMRYLLVCTASGAVLLLLAAASYPFYLQYVMINFAWALVLALAFTYLMIFAGMSRNPIIVGVAKGPDGSNLNRRVFVQVVLFGLIPILTFFGSKFPFLGRILFSWMSPALKAFNF